MPDCFEKSLKKLRCLLRFYIMLITPQTPLMEETWKAIRDMDLVQTEEELLDKIKVAMIEVQKSCKDTKQIDTAILKSIDVAAQRINECNSKIDQDRASAAQNKSMIEAHKLNAAFKFLNGFLDKLA
jgi:DNA helicase IV